MASNISYRALRKNENDFVALPEEPGRGSHFVRIDPRFGKQPSDFPTNDEFLRALRAWNKENFKPLKFNM